VLDIRLDRHNSTNAAPPPPRIVQPTGAGPVQDGSPRRRRISSMATVQVGLTSDLFWNLMLPENTDMRIRLKALFATTVSAIASYLTSQFVHPGLSGGILAIVGIAITTYLFCEHWIPRLERRFGRRQIDGQPVFKMEGLWWEMQEEHPHLKIAGVNLRYNSQTERISLDGKAYNNDGSEGAVFRSLESVVLPDMREIFWHWEGNLNSQRGIMKGVGTMVFTAVQQGPFREGLGNYTEFATANRPMHFVKFTLIRFTKQEEQLWESGNERRRRRAVTHRLAEYRRVHAPTKQDEESSILDQVRSMPQQKRPTPT